jgi:SAM-dependent MidA family methyltransferase
VSTLHGIVLDEIRRRGPMSFARFMELALYHPEHGYYASGARRTGWGGHFVTSPELDPAFGELWCGGLAQVWTACGRPPTFEVVEVGGGEGAFAATVLSAAPPLFGRALRYRLVEPVGALRERQRKRLEGLAGVSWSARLGELGPIECGCLIANEVLDNQPVHLVERSGGEVRELRVAARDGGLELTHAPLAEDLARRLRDWGLEPPAGGRVEAPVAAERLVRRAAGLLRRGAVVLVDYGLEAGELAARPAGTLASYSESGADDLVLDRPGDKDITAHVNWTLVRRWLREAGLVAVGPLRQRDVLRALGSGAVAERLAAERRSAERTGRGAAAVRALSRRQALGALEDPAGLGGLGVMVGLSGIKGVGFAT